MIPLPKSLLYSFVFLSPKIAISSSTACKPLQWEVGQQALIERPCPISAVQVSSVKQVPRLLGSIHGDAVVACPRMLRNENNDDVRTSQR